MRNKIFSDAKPIPNRRSLSVVAVSGDSRRGSLIDALLADENDYGPIFLEPFSQAYARIRQVIPDLVIVYCEMGDAAGCQLLSMLKMDAGLSGILVVTCLGVSAEYEDTDVVPHVSDYAPRLPQPIQMN